FARDRAPGAETPEDAGRKPFAENVGYRRGSPPDGARERDPQRDLARIFLRRDCGDARHLCRHRSHVPEAHLSQAGRALEDRGGIRGEPPGVDPVKFLARASALVLALAAHATQAQEPVVIHVLDRADFVLWRSRVPPPDDAPWKPVSLPDNWYLSHPGDTQVGWYRFTYDLSPEQARIPHAIYLMRNSARRIDFWFNGRRHSANVAIGDPGARNWSPPYITTVSVRNLIPGRNVLHIRVVAVPEIRHELTRAVIAQGCAGRSPHVATNITQVTTLFMFGAAALIAGLLAGAFWLRERGDTTLLWFSITALAWAVTAFPWLHAVFTPRAFFQGPLAFTLRFAYAVPMLILCLR